MSTKVPHLCRSRIPMSGLSLCSQQATDERSGEDEERRRGPGSVNSARTGRGRRAQASAREGLRTSGRGEQHADTGASPYQCPRCLCDYTGALTAPRPRRVQLGAGVAAGRRRASCSTRPSGTDSSDPYNRRTRPWPDSIRADQRILGPNDSKKPRDFDMKVAH